MTPFQLQLSIKTSGLSVFLPNGRGLKEDKIPVLDRGGLFKDNALHEVTALSADIEGMDALSLKYWLSKFVEIAKKSGGRYPPMIVYGIISAVKRYLQEKNGSEALNPLDAGD